MNLQEASQISATLVQINSLQNVINQVQAAISASPSPTIVSVQFDIIGGIQLPAGTVSTADTSGWLNGFLVSLNNQMDALMGALAAYP